jgi:alpha-beta hydrolase superfamily lysophospholipase
MDSNIARPAWIEGGRSLDVELVGPRQSPKPPLMFLPEHGCDRTWSFYPYLLEQLAQDRPVLLLPPPAPVRPSQERARVQAVLDAVERGSLPDGCDWPRRRLGLMGHGQGVALALLAGAERPAAKGIVGLSAWCTLRRDGLPAEVIEDLAAHAADFQLELAARAVTCPVVLLHGEEDAAVEFLESERLYHWLPKDSTSLVILEKTGHSLGAKHPFAGTNKELERCVRVAREFFDREL